MILNNVEQELEKGKGHLADAQSMILQLLMDCPYCEVDERASSDEERWFTFLRVKDKTNEYLHVNLTWALKEFTGESSALNKEGFRRLEVRLEITDRHGNGSGTTIFQHSTALGTSATFGECGVVTQFWRWLRGFVLEWVMQKKYPDLR